MSGPLDGATVLFMVMIMLGTPEVALLMHSDREIQSNT